MLKRSDFIQQGFETREPEIAADRYIQALNEVGRDISGGSVLVLGYGGYFGLGVALLRRGARHVTLCDPYAKLDHNANRALADSTTPYLQVIGRKTVVNPEWITLIHKDIQSVAPEFEQYFDHVFSSSVYEHLENVDGTTAALAHVSSSGCFHLHFIDLRDHYFRYPFEMLCYTDWVWRTFLNPDSNLNRLRAWRYEAVFRKYFQNVKWETLESDLKGFRDAEKRIHPEFRSGEEQLDAITRILVHASNPLTNASKAGRDY